MSKVIVHRRALRYLERLRACDDQENDGILEVYVKTW